MATRNLIRAQNAVFGHFRGRSNLTHPPIRLRSRHLTYIKVVTSGGAAWACYSYSLFFFDPFFVAKRSWQPRTLYFDSSSPLGTSRALRALTRSPAFLTMAAPTQAVGTTLGTDMTAIVSIAHFLLLVPAAGCSEPCRPVCSRGLEPGAACGWEDARRGHSHRPPRQRLHETPGVVGAN